MRDIPALDGGGDPPEGYKPLMAAVGLQVPLGNCGNSRKFYPLSFLAVGSDPLGIHPSAGPRGKLRHSSVMSLGTCGDCAVPSAGV